jgi:predicted PolB exonuclease-like 3'-5' exonuclease
MDYLVLDVETTGLSPLYGDRITCLCARHSGGKDIKLCLDSESDIIKYFFEFLSQFKDFVLVSKNGKLFDVPFIMWRAYFWEQIGVAQQLLVLEHYDLQEITKKWIGLDDLATVLRIEGKSGNGLQAIQLWNDGKREELMAYCFQDVLVTEQVYKRFINLPYIRISGGD